MMKGSEAILAICKGKKVRDIKWPETQWIYLSEDGIRDQDGQLFKLHFRGLFVVVE